MIIDIVSPSGRVFKGQASRFKAPGVEGSFEVLKNHAPMVAAIGIGSIVVTDNEGQPITFATSGGFVEVLHNTVSVVAESAEMDSDIDVDRAKAAEQRAIEALANAHPAARAEMAAALERARNRVRVAMGSVGTGR